VFFSSRLFCCRSFLLPLFISLALSASHAACADASDLGVVRPFKFAGLLSLSAPGTCINCSSDWLGVLVGNLLWQATDTWTLLVDGRAIRVARMDKGRCRSRDIPGHAA
jgi:hypothetical protein